MDETERESKPLFVEIPTDPEKIAQKEAENALRQFDKVVEIIDEVVASSDPFVLRPSVLLELNRLATEGTNNYSGVYRPHPVEIIGSVYVPPPQEEVPSLVEEMCGHVNKHWDDPPIRLSAYLMWRVNWIHPFSDGNGRTARAVSYAVLCIRLGYRLPGITTIPEQIAANKQPYYQALEEADKAFAEGRIDVLSLENLLSQSLATQLVQIHQEATGRKESG